MLSKYLPFMILASLFIIFNAYIFTKKIRFLRKAVSTNGIVKKVGSESSDSGANVYFKNVEFETEEGKKYVVTSVMGSGSDKNTEGQSVKILYLADDPENAVINDFKNIWGFESIVFLLGGIALFVYFETF